MSLHGLSQDAWERYRADGKWDYRIVAPGLQVQPDGRRRRDRHPPARAGRGDAAGARGDRAAVTRGASRMRTSSNCRRRTTDRIHSWHLFPIRLRLDRLSIDRNAFIDELKDARRRLLRALAAAAPPSLLRGDVRLAPGGLPVATAVWERLVSLPIFPGMREEEIEHVVETTSRPSAGTTGARPLGGAAPRAGGGRDPAAAPGRGGPGARRPRRRGARSSPCAAMAVVVTSGRPAFFRQHARGPRWRPFSLVKLRSMRCSARAGRQVTARGDDRVTPVGRFLRRSKLDELPELWNILRGEMSFVGPRPEVPRVRGPRRPRLEAEILQVRPGLTDPVTLTIAERRGADGRRRAIRSLLPGDAAAVEARGLSRVPASGGPGGRDFGVSGTQSARGPARPAPPTRRLRQGLGPARNARTGLEKEGGFR